MADSSGKMGDPREVFPHRDGKGFQAQFFFGSPFKYGKGGGTGHKKGHRCHHGGQKELILQQERQHAVKTSHGRRLVTWAHHVKVSSGFL